VHGRGESAAIAYDGARQIGSQRSDFLRHVAITRLDWRRLAASLRQPRDRSEKKPAMHAGEFTRSHRGKATAMS
jgi:hypothetical protein